MSVTTVENDPKVLRRLAQVSLLFALASVLVTAAAQVLLPNAAASGQWVVVWAGGLMGLSAFAFGVMISLRKPFARRLGFVVVALACLAACKPESAAPPAGITTSAADSAPAQRIEADVRYLTRLRSAAAATDKAAQ